MEPGIGLWSLLGKWLAGWLATNMPQLVRRKAQLLQVDVGDKGIQTATLSKPAASSVLCYCVRQYSGQRMKLDGQ